MGPEGGQHGSTPVLVDVLSDGELPDSVREVLQPPEGKVANSGASAQATSKMMGTSASIQHVAQEVPGFYEPGVLSADRETVVPSWLS